tara:strand:- start:2053 stop:2430 length:378 start_codon:yes stop_codon:yes gene_type:complete
MSDDPSDEDIGMVYSIPVKDTLVIHDECVVQLGFLESLLFSDPLDDLGSSNQALTSLLCESYHIVYKIAQSAGMLLEQAEREGEPGSEELLIGKKEMIYLQTSMLARYYVSKELVELAGISTAIH